MASHAFTTWTQKLLNSTPYQKFRSLPVLGQKLVLVGSITGIVSIILTLVYFFVDRKIALGSMASILAGLATGLGALPVIFVKEVSKKALNTMLGGAAGVMLAATSFSLIVPGIQYGSELWPGIGVFVVAFGILLGAALLVWVDNWLPYERYLQEGERFASLKKVWLFVAAVALHNLPEGCAVGVSFGSLDWCSRVAEYSRRSSRSFASGGFGLSTWTGCFYCHSDGSH